MKQADLAIPLKVTDRVVEVTMLAQYKLDRVGPLITDPPPTSFTNLSEKRKKKKREKKLTPDT